MLQIKTNINKNLKYNLVKYKNKLITKKIVNPRILSITIIQLFNNSYLSQLMEEINPITELTHKRRITFKKGKTSVEKTSNLELREINPSHFKKICPVETSEGKNAGLTWSLTKDSRINNIGLIQNPIFKRIKIKHMRI